MRIKTLLLLSLLVLTSCKGGQNDKKAEVPFSPLPFPVVQLPSVITDQTKAVEFIAENHWNSFLDPSRSYPSDSLLSSGVLKTEIEQQFADWTAVVSMTDLQIVERAVSGIYEKALRCELKDSSSNVFETMADLFMKYYYDPNSPMRNEEIYLYFVRKYAEYPGHTEELRAKYQREVKLCSFNRVGETASDFTFSDRKGKKYRLHDIESEYTLLFFSNPGCEACMDIINVLKGDQLISSMITSGRLSVLNIYIDEDLQSWFSYMPIYPEEWYNGFDPDFVLRNYTLYNIRAIPSLYLLDRKKKVIFKDSPENIIFNYLYETAS